MSNSYHEIQSLVSHINLYDEISIHETNSRKTIVKFRGAFAKFTSGKNNSILSTITLLKKLSKNIRYKNFVVTVKKYSCRIWFRWWNLKCSYNISVFNEKI
ncbi:MAG: hypothetical protein FF85_04910 [alpha proteobacterium QL1]|nr:MAG: hypothetical protein FF85_04910 [alpha proteobacterium QL1]